MDVKQNNAEAAHEQIAPRCSNFSIDEILKPSFGPPKRHWLSAFSPVRNGSRTISTSGLSLDLQSNRHESAFVRLSPSDSQLSVCSSPDSNPTTSSPVATSPGSDGNENHCGQHGCFVPDILIDLHQVYKNPPKIPLKLEKKPVFSFC